MGYGDAGEACRNPVPPWRDPTPAIRGFNTKSPAGPSMGERGFGQTNRHHEPIGKPKGVGSHHGGLRQQNKRKRNTLNENKSFVFV
jgi:hypothetical protein